MDIQVLTNLATSITRDVDAAHQLLEKAVRKVRSEAHPWDHRTLHLDEIEHAEFASKAAYELLNQVTSSLSAQPRRIQEK